MIMNNILRAIKENQKIGITFHSSPDGDSLGSALGLLLGLRKLNKDAYIISKEVIPDSFKYLPSSHLIDGNTAEVTEDTEVVIVLDCGDVKRISAHLNIKNKEYITINIDHHLSNELYADLNYVDSNSAAVSEIIYQMLKMLGIKLDKAIAECLYTSLVTDTGSFKFSGTTSVTHMVAGDLINTGFDFNRIHRLIFENIKYKKVKLIGNAIENLHLIKNKICVITLQQNVFSNLGLDDRVDTSDIINLGLEIDTVTVAALFKESPDGIKISLRSKEHIDVRKIAEKYNGGGHKKASGLFLKDKTLEEATKLIINDLEKELI